MNRRAVHNTVCGLTALLFAAQPGPRAAAQSWKPADAPLMTRSANDVSPEKVWPEYPRPQLVRPQWVNLNGLWDYAIVPIAPVPDASGHKHDGSAVGAPTWRATGGPAGGPALEFNGTTDGVRLPRVVQDDFTIAFWVKTTQKGGVDQWYTGIGLVDGEVAGVTDDFGTALVGGRFAFGVGKPDTTIKSTTAINDGRWHHVAAVRERGTGSIRLFVDGLQESAGTAGKQSLTAPQSLMIGRLQTGINAFRGSIADVRIYNRPLSKEEVVDLGKPTDKKAGAGLVGWWRFDEAPKNVDPARVAYQGKILVPFPVESALSGVRRPLMPWQLLYYRRTFKAPDLAGGKRLLLHFGAVDWQVKVFINGKLVGEHTGGFDAFSFDITDAVRPGGENEIVVIVFDPTGGLRGKQNLVSFSQPGGIMYTPCSGIWQTVWLEAVPARRIEELILTPDVDRGVLRITVKASRAGAGTEFEAVTSSGGKEVARARGRPGAELALPIKDVRLWSPDDPFLYDLRVKLGDDEVASYFGMRKVSLGKDEKGVTRILLNGKFVFQVGVLDQGYWPDGIYLAPTDEALRFDVEQMRKLGLNMARKHVKVEPQRWYYWCDKLGLLVWQDMPSGDINRGNDAKKDGVAITPEAGRQFEAELKAMVEQHRNHPSIILWVVFNEGWGQHDTVRLTKWVKELDPTRLVSNASGWHDRRCGDVIDLHDYPGPGSPKPEPARAAVLGEFGGLGLAVPGHVWTKKTWGYRGESSQEALTRAYLKLWRKAWQLKDAPGLSAAVYTQWTDVEAECNGLWTYDRKVLKVDAKQAIEAHRGSAAASPRGETAPPVKDQPAKPANGTEKSSEREDKLPPGTLLRLGTDELRHPYSSSVTYSADGTILATGGMDVRLWDVRTKRLLRVLPLPDRQADGDACQLAFTADGKTLFVRGAGLGHATAFDVGSGRKLFRYQPEGGVSAFDVTADGTILATGGGNKGEVVLWKTATRERLRTIRANRRTQPGHPRDSSRDDVYVQSLSFSPDGKWLASSALYDDALRVFEVATGKEKYALPAPALYQTRALFSPDGYLMYYRVPDPAQPNKRTTALWDLATGKVHRDYDRGPVWGPGYHAVAFSPDGKWMAGDGGDGRLCVWDRATGKIRFRDSVAHFVFGSVSFSRDGDTLAACNGAVEMWDLRTGRNLLEDGGHTGSVRALALSPDGATIASSDGTIRLWDTKTGKTRHLMHTQGISCLAFSPDGRTLASGGYHGYVQLWDAGSGKELRRIPIEANAVRLEFSPDGATLAVANGQNLTIVFFEAATGKQVRRLRWSYAGNSSTSYHPFRFSPDGKYIAGLVHDNEGDAVGLWDLTRREPVLVAREERRIYDLAFSPDGEFLAWSDAKDQVRLLDVRANKLLPPLKIAGPYSLAFTPDGRYLAAGQTLHPLDPKRRPVELPFRLIQFAFSRDGRILVAVPPWGSTLLVMDARKLRE